MPQADTIYSDTTTLPFYQLTEPYPQPTEADVDLGIPLDSLFRPVDASDTVYRTSLFTGHSLTPHHSTLQQRPATAAPAWIFIVATAICAIIYLYYRNHKLNLRDMLKSTIDGTSPEKQIRGAAQGLALLPIALLLAATLGMVVWYMALQSTGPLGYLLTTLALTLAYLLRNGLLSTLAAVFDKRHTMSSYITSNYVYHLLLTTVVAPLTFALAYIQGAADGIATSIGILTALVYLMRLLHGAKLFLTKSSTFSFFLFYYLCTIEMIPLLAALKWIISQ